MKKKITPGDYFLLPFAGKKRDLLIKAVKPAYGTYGGHWDCAKEDGDVSTYMLDSCRRVSASEAAQIIKASNVTGLSVAKIRVDGSAIPLKLTENGMMAMTTVQKEILKCLQDNEGQMSFDDLKFDCGSVSSPQGLGRAISTMVANEWVSLFKSWDDAHSIEITGKGESALALARHKA